MSGKTGSEKQVELETYATLINRQIVVPSSSSPHFAVEQHYFFRLMSGLLRQVVVDEEWYLNKYPDVKEAVQRGQVSSARDHYISFGFYEHRLPYQIMVLEVWYLKAYADVKAAVDKGIYASAQSHFEIQGFREGRLPYPNFVLGAPGVGASRIGAAG